MDLFYTNINQFTEENRYKRGHIAGRQIIKYCAENIYNIKNPTIEIVNKKPKFKYSDIQFSISHSGEYAAVCFDNNPLGFDLEHIIDRDYKLITKRMNFILEEDSLVGFYKRWTEFEAAYKLQSEVKYRFSNMLNENYIFTITSGNNFKLDKVKELFF